ncbi:Rpn family recombination-promoting nuclease/putative transposase [Candidatus Tisiphia endosymbiont of Metellina segmentata]|uniref:Rpn family recombination-promoting nuclease/putative transposase n=1 Tax=Candidatus Tisiphia endosymbiont of Metellina segmentata TaxID=3066274 RepID=UPI0039776AE0
MENPLVSHEFFDTHLPKHIKDLVDFPSLKMDNTTFVEPNLRNTISDVLFYTKFGKQDGYLYLLVEHQSSPDHFMAFRLFKYMLNICDRYLTEHPKTKTLPLVYPLIFFNGTGKYKVSRNLWGLFDDSKFVRDIWANDYQLVNVHDIADEELKKRAWSGILEFFMKHIKKRNLLKKWQEIADMLPELTKVTIGYNYIEMILCYTLTKIEQSDKIKLEQLLTSKLNQETGKQLMGSLAQHWEQVGETRGIQIGETRGIQIGETRGIQIGKVETVQEMLKEDYPIETITKLTKLSLKAIEEIRKDLAKGK